MSKNEQTLSESEQLLQGTIDALTGHIAILNRDGKILKVNRAWREFADKNLLLDKNYGIGSNYIEACRPAAENDSGCATPGVSAAQGIFDVIEGKLPLFEYEYPCHSETEQRWFLMRVTRFGEGENLYVVVAHENITLRRIAENSLRESESSYRVLAETASDVIVRIDEDSRIVFINEASRRVLGYKPEELIGQSLTILMPEEMLKAHMRGMKRYLQTGRRTISWEGMELPAIHKNGDIISLEISFGEVVRDKKHYFIGIARDITERKQSQEALIAAERRGAKEYLTLLERIVPLAQTLGTAGDLKAIYRAMHEFVCNSMNCDGFFVGLYEAEKQQRRAVYGWAEGEELDISELPPMPVASLENAGPNARVILTGETVVLNNYYEKMKSRRHVLVGDETQPKPQSSLIVPMKVMNKVIGTIEVQSHENEAYIRENTVAMEMAANLAAVAIENVRLLEIEARARLEAETANRAKDEFLSVLSHELRTPLNSMYGWVRMLSSGVLDEKGKRHAIEVIDRNIRMQNNLIEDLLDVSRIISGKMRIETEEVDFVSIVKSAVETARPLAESKKLSLEFHSAVRTQKIIGDSTRLQQIVSNLVNNAVKFTPEFGTITLNLTSPDHKARLEVSDTGIGIKPEYLNVIFDRFHQADSTTRRSHSGLGLGLTIVKHLTELHGGTVKVSSEGEGRGSTFTVELPEISKSGKNLAGENKTPPKEIRTDLRGVKILLVDDDADGLLPLQILLKTQEAEVVCAFSAAEALEILAKQRFDLLVSDIGMPELDGFELIKQVRQMSEDGNYFLPAIALTAYASMQDRERALEAGFQYHLAKPIDFDHFILTIKNLIKTPDL